MSVATDPTQKNSQADDPKDLIVVTDFDGTLTEKDIGNELCTLFRPQLFKELHEEYTAGKINLRNYQQKLWTDFPCSRETFILESLKAASLRPGVNEFLEYCAHRAIPVYIASCGMDLYITTVIDRFISRFAQAAIKGWSANLTFFGEYKLDMITAPDSDMTLPEPLHKGRWARELAHKHRGAKGDAKIVAIGNGGSDRTFLGHVDKIFATEKLIKTCQDAQQPFTPFQNFFDILKGWPSS